MNKYFEWILFFLVVMVVTYVSNYFTCEITHNYEYGSKYQKIRCSNPIGYSLFIVMLYVFVFYR